MNNPQNTYPARFASFRDSVRAFLYISVTSFRALLVGLLSPRALRPILLPVRSRRRGAGMLEYALIAALAVGVFLFLRTFFDELFTDVTDDIKENLNDPINK
jgi:Flp pilus assembly pilin Flp